MAHDHGIENGILVKGELVLVEHRYALSRPFANLAPVRLKITCKDLQKGGFTSAVRPYKAVAVARGELDVNVLEDYPLAIGKSYIGCGYHNSFLIKYIAP
jgi:hypothetical protein